MWPPRGQKERLWLLLPWGPYPPGQAGDGGRAVTSAAAQASLLCAWLEESAGSSCG